MTQPTIVEVMKMAEEIKELHAEIARLTEELAEAEKRLNCYPITYIHDLEWQKAKLGAELAELRTVLKSKEIIIDNQEKRINELAERLLKND